MTDKQRLLAYFKSKPNTEVNAYLEIVASGLRILEYSGRISDIRKDLGCTCGEDQNTCTSREHIRNTRKGFYKFVTGQEEIGEVYMIKFEDLEKRRQKLARQYVEAREKGDEGLMRLIEVQGRAVRRAMDLESTKAAVKKTLF